MQNGTVEQFDNISALVENDVAFGLHWQDLDGSMNYVATNKKNVRKIHVFVRGEDEGKD
jgi:hypothetical protein